MHFSGSKLPNECEIHFSYKMLLISASAKLRVRKTQIEDSEAIMFSLDAEFEVPLKHKGFIEASSVWARGTEVPWTLISYSENSSIGARNQTYEAPNEPGVFDPLAALFIPCFLSDPDNERAWTMRVFTGRKTYSLEAYSDLDRDGSGDPQRYYVGREGGQPLFKILNRQSLSIHVDSRGLLQSLDLNLPLPFGHIKLERSEIKVS